VLLGSSLLAGFHRGCIFYLHLIDFIDTAVVEVVFRQDIIIFDIVLAHTSSPRKTRAIYSATQRVESRCYRIFSNPDAGPIKVRSDVRPVPPDAGWRPPPE